MKIVILDSFGVDPGDMDWRELQALGDCTFHDRTPAHLVVEDEDVGLGREPFGEDDLLLVSA